MDHFRFTFDESPRLKVYLSAMKSLAVRGALAFGVPVLLVFALCIGFAMTGHAQGYYFLLAGPLSGIAGGLAYGKRWGMPIVLAMCFATIGLMFSLQDVRSPWFSDVIWTGFVSAFMFWVVGGSAMLTLRAEMRFNGAAMLAVPGAIAGFVFQFLNGPGYFMFDLGSRKWWGDAPWAHLILWLIAGAGGGWLLGKEFQRRQVQDEDEPKFESGNPWAVASLVAGALGVGLSALYLLRSVLPLGLINSLSPPRPRPIGCGAGACSHWALPASLRSAAKASSGQPLALFVP